MSQEVQQTIPISRGRKYKYPEYRAKYYQDNKEEINSRRNARFHADKALRPEYYMWLGARDRCKVSGRQFDIEPSDIVIPEFCPIFKFPLQVNKGKLQFNSPVLDRINNDLGYLKGNVWVISSKANLLKGNCTLEEIIMMGEWAKNEISKL